MRERGEAVGEAVLRPHRHRVAAQGGFPCLERGLALVEGGLAGVEHRKSVARPEPQGRLPKSLQAGAHSLRPSDTETHWFRAAREFAPCLINDKGKTRCASDDCSS